MELPIIARYAGLKGLDLVGTGDSLHKEWLRHIKHELVKVNDGIYSIGSTNFLVTTEVEDAKRVHHLILFPSISSAEDLRERFKGHSSNIDKDGRPHLNLNGESIVDYVRDVDAMIGPAHAFTPWTAIYKEYDSLSGCYGDNLKHIKFLELGLSADTCMADRIPELKDLTYMSNSDCHSPLPNRLGREFNRIVVEELNFNEIKRSIIEHKFKLNVGLNPKEGKYHITACSRCYLKFKLKDAIGLKWRCPECKGRIKKGVNDRINELACRDEPKHPGHRPPYIHILPLAEVISLATGIRTLSSKTIQNRWHNLVEAMKSEINVLIDSDIEEIKKIDPEVGRIIEKFRTNRIRYITGGGGKYGQPTLKNAEDRYWGYGQSSLGDF